MAAKHALKELPALGDLRKKGLQAYWVIRKVLQLMDRISHRGIEGPAAFTAAKTLEEIERSVADGALGAFEKEVRGLIRDARATLRSGQEEFKSWFGAELEKHLQERTGLRLQGQFPLLHAAHFRIRLDLDTGNAKISYGPDDEPLGKAKVDPEEVAATVASIVRELEGTRLPDPSFLDKIHAAYDRVLRFRTLRSGEKAPILEVLKEFVWLIQSKRFGADPRRKNFREYTRVHFSYNLHKLESRTLNGRTLELTVAAREQAARREEHLWVPINDRGDGTHFATLAFREK